MRILVTGASGFAGSALIPRLQADGHDVIGFGRDPSRVTANVPVVTGDIHSGAGLDEALDGIDVAYYLVHSMEPSTNGTTFAQRELESAERFVDAAQRAKLGRTIYLGGLVPAGSTASTHLGSRLAVEEALLGGLPGSVAFRASIVIGHRSRSFRFLVRLVERLPVLGLPSWRHFRTQPIDERDIIALLAAAADRPEIAGRSLDLAGPEVLAYGEIIERIRDLMIVGRPRLPLPFSLTPIASRVAALLADEDHSLIGPLMEGLSDDLLPRDLRAAEVLGVRLHGFDSAVEHALRRWEATEPLKAR